MTSQEVETHFNRIGTAASGIMKGMGVIGAAIGGAMLAVTEGTREYRAQMGLLDGAFQAVGHSSEEAKRTYSELNAVLGDTEQAVEAAQHIALLADNEKELTTWTDIATGVYATFGNSLPIESLAESSQEVSRNGILTGGLIDALVWAGISEEEFQKKLDACTTEQERQDLIMNTLNGTYSKASEQYKATNADVMEARKAQERLTDEFSNFGKVCEPVLTAVKNKVADMVGAAVPHFQNLINKVKDAKKWVQDNKDTVDKWKAAIVGVSVSVGSFLLIMNWSRIMGAAKTAILGVRAAVILFNAALKANPIGFVVSLVIGLVAAFISLWKNNEKFRQFWINLWAKIKSVSGSAVDWIKRKFNGFKDMAASVRSTFNGIARTVSDKMNTARDKVRDAVKKIKGFFDFKWSLPKLKMPTFSLKGKFSLAPPSVPKIGVKWNAAGGVLTQPTIFGRAGNTLLGGGEAGKEAIAPISVLQDYVRQAVRAEVGNESVGRIIIEQTALLMEHLNRTMPKGVYLDGNILVGELTPAIDRSLSDRYMHIGRGNVR